VLGVIVIVIAVVALVSVGTSSTVNG